MNPCLCYPENTSCRTILHYNKKCPIHGGSMTQEQEFDPKHQRFDSSQISFVEIIGNEVTIRMNNGKLWKCTPTLQISKVEIRAVLDVYNCFEILPKTETKNA